MTNTKFSRPLLLATCASAFLLTACGGGGSGGVNNNLATITGSSSGAVTASSTTANGVLTVVDPDVGQSSFALPSTLAGIYGVWTVTITGSTATWRYTLDASKAPSTAASDVLSLKSLDGSATQAVTVTIAASGGNTSALVTTVPDPVYTGAYASEKVAVFNRLNDDRSKCGFGKLAQNSKLDLAAQNHADYHALNKLENTHYETQGLPGYTGYEAGARITHAGYAYSYGSEDIAQTTWGSWYAGSINHSLVETSATATLKRLYASIYHMAGLMNRTTEVGLGISTFSYTGDGSSNAKTLNMNFAVPASNSTGQLLASSVITSFPCEGVTGLHPAFFGENPDPFPNVNRDVNPYGQPIYVTSGPNTTIALTSGTVTLRGGAAVPTTTLTSSNDPQSRLQSNQVFLVPTARLANNSTYDVSLAGTSTGLISTSNPNGTFTKSFTFTTGTVLSQ
ncbi:VCBS domain-containing protein [Limnohabitans sp. DM1]|uniref:VCBS domain-containing protein n=1 Tax=Limnohabitans sp. DM1 TaxID=1597955 RepID=UPI000A8E8F59|nr:VCBS domain-containing protein [Limnohabitans sp. DM1]